MQAYRSRLDHIIGLTDRFCHSREQVQFIPCFTGSVWHFTFLQKRKCFVIGSLITQKLLHLPGEPLLIIPISDTCTIAQFNDCRFPSLPWRLPEQLYTIGNTAGDVRPVGQPNCACKIVINKGRIGFTKRKLPGFSRTILKNIFPKTHTFI